VEYEIDTVRSWSQKCFLWNWYCKI